MKEASDAAQSGVVLKVKVLEGEAEIAEARHTLGSIEDQIADMTNSFNDLVGLPLPTETELIEPSDQSEEGADPEPRPEATAAAAPENEAMKHNPELLSAQQAVKKAHAGLNAARAEYIPDVSLVLQHTYQNGIAAPAGNSSAVGVHVDWTISGVRQAHRLVRERKSQVAEAEENLRATENKVRMDVRIGNAQDPPIGNRPRSRARKRGRTN